MSTPHPRLVGKTNRVQFCMPTYRHTDYNGKHNHRGTVAHRFLVQLSYARQSEKKTPMKELADLINYAQAYTIENHLVSSGHSLTNPEVSKIALYLHPSNCKRVQQLLYELRYTLGILPLGQRSGYQGHVLFNTIEVQDYLIS